MTEERRWVISVDGADVPMSQSAIDARLAEEAAAEEAGLLERVTSIRDARLAAGYADQVTGKRFATDDKSIGLWTAIGSAAGLAMVMQLDPMPSFQIIPEDNDTITLTALETFALFNGRVMPWVSATYLFAREMKNAIQAGDAPADVTSGWP